MKTKEEIFTNVKIPGILMLILNSLFLLVCVGLFVFGITSLEENSGIQIAVMVTSTILFIVNSLFWVGFMLIEPNEAMVMIFFGKYEGTIKENGFWWANPFYTKKKLTLRARNLDAEPIKVNDKTGNPIMIGVVVVWRVTDTYKASFSIDNNSSMGNHAAGSTVSGAVKLNEKMLAYQNFVKIQSDSAVRYVAGMYAYDHTGVTKEGELTLRSGGEDVHNILENQMNERLSIAGIEVVEARINYLAYAPEIAAVMLRRQQADAIIAAREKIVDGAVGMVKMALDKLSAEEIIDLDDDKRAAMVSNLMVVLCSESSTQPVINTGTLHN
jgi:regulator of protease activity HflC (stomatin/prohibitin superfamily)